MQDPAERLLHPSGQPVAAVGTVGEDDPQATELPQFHQYEAGSVVVLPVGSMYDDRPASPTRGAVMDVFLGPDEYSLAVIAPGIWHGFQGMSHPAAILANCATEPSDQSELDRLDPESHQIPYDWKRSPG